MIEFGGMITTIETIDRLLRFLRTQLRRVEVSHRVGRSKNGSTLPFGRSHGSTRTRARAGSR
jgi:hypothetical protein